MTQARQKRIQSFAFVISIVVAVCFSWFFFENPAEPEQPYKIESDEKINPNNAPVASLVRLPGIGISRAEAIVAYRENSSKENSKEPAFRNSDDLQKVKGIGPKTVKNITYWLKFEQGDGL